MPENCKDASPLSSGFTFFTNNDSCNNFQGYDSTGNWEIGKREGNRDKAARACSATEKEAQTSKPRWPPFVMPPGIEQQSALLSLRRFSPSVSACPYRMSLLLPLKINRFLQSWYCFPSSNIQVIRFYLSFLAADLKSRRPRTQHPIPSLPLPSPQIALFLPPIKRSADAHPTRLLTLLPSLTGIVSPHPATPKTPRRSLTLLMMLLQARLPLFQARSEAWNKTQEQLVNATYPAYGLLLFSQMSTADQTSAYLDEVDGRRIWRPAKKCRKQKSEVKLQNFDREDRARQKQSKTPMLLRWVS
ncbi:hypothetical protein FPQ18DRAFT_301729 [Pyronema domesticum]|nr:hypothetical protein FPQ18DRAFT_301729 [Pyronema domesticum]